MEKQLLSMEKLEKVSGGNIFTDAWDWVCDKFSSDDEPKPVIKQRKRDYLIN